MKALVLAAGEGSRLFPFTAFTPKPLLPVGGRPMVAGIVRQLAAVGCDEVILAIAGDAPSFEAALGDGSLLGTRLRYSAASAPLGKAGEIAHARGLLRGCGDFLCIHGDLLANVDLSALARRHRAAGALATIVASPHYHPPVGIVRLGPDGRVVGFDERPQLQLPVSIGLYAFSDRLLGQLDALRPPAGRFELGEHVFPRLAVAGELAAYISAAPWIDVGTVDAYRSVCGGPSFDGSRWPVLARAAEPRVRA